MALVAVYVLMAALADAGASNAIVYGVYVVTATLIVLGAFAAVRAAPGGMARLGVAVAIMLVAAGSAFAGPRRWTSDGVGLASSSSDTAPPRLAATRVGR